MNSIGRCTAIVVAFVAAGMANAFARDGQFVPAPYAAAARVIRSAKLGDVKSQTVLGRMYATGRGVPRDYIEAAKWVLPRRRPRRSAGPIRVGAVV